MKLLSFYIEKSLGIDIRDESVSMVLLGQNLNRSEIIASRYFQLAGKIDEEAGQRQFLKEITAFIDDFAPSLKSLSIGLPRSLVTIKTFTLPAPNIETADTMVEFELDRHFVSGLDNLNVSHHVRQAAENQFHVTSAAIKQNDAEKIIQLVQSLGLECHDLAVSTMAHHNLVNTEKSKREGLEIFVDVHPDAFEVTIEKNQYIEMSRRIAFTSATTDQIRSLLRPSQEDLDHLIKRVTPEVIRGVESTLFSCKNVTDDETPDQIYLFGAEHIAQGLASQLEADTEIPTEFYLPETFLKHVSDFDPSRMNTALAIALETFKVPETKLNLISSKGSENKKRKTKTTFFLVVLAALLLAGFFVSRESHLQDTLSSLTLQLEAVKKEVGNLEVVDRKFDELTTLTTLMNTIDSEWSLKLPIINELSRVLPRDTFLNRLSISQNKIEIQGFSSSASKLIPLIENSALFQNAGFNGSIVNQRAGEKFTIRAEISPQT